mmetsp:Transcript_20881/g.31365  ORF Transcript_20881/g.31365 Transcript_20881/m.31365 type:complete len:137 (+) Transcript_20881:2982-3392(+)
MSTMLKIRQDNKSPENDAFEFWNMCDNKDDDDMMWSDIVGMENMHLRTGFWHIHLDTMVQQNAHFDDEDDEEGGDDGDEIIERVGDEFELEDDSSIPFTMVEEVLDDASFVFTDAKTVVEVPLPLVLTFLDLYGVF